MAPIYRYTILCLGVAIASPKCVLGDCTCSGLDYTNGGSYLIDGTSDSNFVFTSEFAGA